MAQRLGTWGPGGRCLLDTVQCLLLGRQGTVCLEAGAYYSQVGVAWGRSSEPKEEGVSQHQGEGELAPWRGHVARASPPQFLRGGVGGVRMWRWGDPVGCS